MANYTSGILALKVLTLGLGTLATILIICGYARMDNWDLDWDGGCENKDGAQCPSKWPTTAVLVVSLLAVLVTLASLGLWKWKGEESNDLVSKLYICGGVVLLVVAALALFYGFTVLAFNCQFYELRLKTLKSPSWDPTGHGFVRMPRPGNNKGKIPRQFVFTCDKQVTYSHGWFIAAGAIAVTNAFLHFLTAVAIRRMEM